MAKSSEWDTFSSLEKDPLFSFDIKKKVVWNELPLIGMKTAIVINPNIKIACLAITFPSAVSDGLKEKIEVTVKGRAL